MSNPDPGMMPEYEAMVGVYYQAAMKQAYDVIFQRK